MTQILIIIAIFLSIFIGYVKKVNVGLIAISFAYIIGVFVLKFTPKELIGFWPTNLFFTIFAVSLFYNFAITNGTLNFIAQMILYKTRNYSHGIYLILFLMSVLIAAAGAGFFTTMAICCPLAVSLSKQSGKNVLLSAQMVNLGASGGANFMTSGSGVVFQGLFKDLGLEMQSMKFGSDIFLFTIIYPFILIVLFYIGSKIFYGTKQEVTSAIQKPNPLNIKQKRTLLLMGVMMATVLILPNLYLAFPQVAAFKKIGKMADIGLICIVLTVVGFILELSNEKEVFSRLPWNTLIMLSGMGMLIKLATKTGLVENVANLMSTSIPNFMLPVAFVLVAGILSLFSSTLSVVAPTLFPIVTAMATSNPNINLSVLFVAVVAGSLSTNISPFSSAGSLIQASIDDKNIRDKAFRQQIILGVPLTLFAAMISVFIFSLLAK